MKEMLDNPRCNNCEFCATNEGFESIYKETHPHICMLNPLGELLSSLDYAMNWCSHWVDSETGDVYLARQKLIKAWTA